MKLVIVSHKVCWKSEDSPSGYVTDGGFPLQMKAISELFSETKLIVPCQNKKADGGTIAIEGKNIEVCPLPIPSGKGLSRKISMLGWFAKNGRIIFREIKKADAVHAPIPGDVGTIGMAFALLLKKPLFVRHCGNWFVQRTLAERVWRWSMERFAGGRNVMLATGGATDAPSSKNSNVKWIFSTSLNERQLANAQARRLTGDGSLKLITACRQEARKGTDVTIESLPAILERFPRATLDVVGDGSLLPQLKNRVEALKLGEHVTFHGKVEHSKVLELLSGADLFCYPTSASEGFPKVVLEALACGLPVITTHVSVLPQLIKNGCGLLLEEATASNVAKAVVEVSSNGELYHEMSANAVQTARAFSLEGWRDYIRDALCLAWQVRSLS
jgi:glycosyltransferase involved in cell wall biosynthesis